MPWWLELLVGGLLILVPLAQFKHLGNYNYKAGPGWGKASLWTCPTMIVLMLLIFLGTVLCIFGASGAYSAFNSVW